MKPRTLLAAAALVLGACGGGARREYAQNDLQMLTAFTAKSHCSCLFVMEMDDAFCAAWTKQSPPLARLEVDRHNKQVSASALMLWAAKARWIDAGTGCALVE